MMEFMRRHKRISCALIAVFVLCAVSVAVLEVFSRGAAEIFNREMSKQDMLRGTITVEKLIAHTSGRVRFENLEWKDPKGNTILFAPEGGFKVKIWDVLRGHFDAETIEELTLKEAVFSVHFSKDMKVDFVRPSKDFEKMGDLMRDSDDDWMNKISLVGKSEEELRKIGEWKRWRKGKKITKNWQNFDSKGKRIRMKLTLENCRMEVFYGDRHYMMNHVIFRTDIDTAKKMTIHATAGGFGGTMIGKSISLNGTVDFTSEPVPNCSLSFLFQDIDPSSMGFGMKLHDKMTLYANIGGYITDMEGTGYVKLDKLHLPGLDFSNVYGDVRYSGSKMDFSNVTAEAYGGKLWATGDYDLDTRYYHIYGHAEGLKTSRALRGAHLDTEVTLDIALSSKGHSRDTDVSGKFKSGEGTYYVILPFTRISGRFHNKYHDLRFYDVVIDLGDFKAETDAIHISKDKLEIDALKFYDAEDSLVAKFNPQSRSR